MPNASIKDEKLYEELRDEGDSEEKAARSSNASASRGRSRIAPHGGRSGPYDLWTVPKLRSRAKELGLTGYSLLNKSDLVFELRNH